MLAIRMQRTGRHGHAMFRMVVQESRRTPTSGNIVASLGHYDPHTKTVVIDKEKASFYLEHGAQPSDRVVYLLKNEGVKLPKWVKLDTKKTSGIRNQDKLRKNRPAEPKAEVVVEAVAPAPEPVEVSEEILPEATTKPVVEQSPEPVTSAEESETV